MTGDRDRITGARPVPPGPASGVMRTRVAGLDFDRLTEAQVVDHIINASLRGRGGWVVTPNIDICRIALRDPAQRALVTGASLVVPDGVPLLWAARLRGDPLVERVTGASLIFSLTGAAAKHGRSVYLLGGAPGVAERAAEELRRLYPALAIAGVDSPPVGFDTAPGGIEAVRRRLAAAAPDIVYVGMGFPKQERLIAGLLPSFPAAWFVACGAAIPFAAGAVPRAPRWMQDAGLEWLVRLACEPRRLFQRYIIHDLPFAARLLTRCALERSARSARARRRGQRYARYSLRMPTGIAPQPGTGFDCELFSRAIRDYAKGRDQIQILDAGCGRAWSLDIEGVDYHLTGIDNNEDALHIRREVRRDLDDWICADLRAAPLPAEKYDVIHSSFVLEHVSGAEEALGRLVDSLKPGGLLLIRTPDRQSVYGFLTRVTPHRVHIWYKRWVIGNKNAGKAGRGPWPTVYDTIVSHKGISDFCRARGLIIDHEYSDNNYLFFFGPLRRPVDSALRLIALLSFGRLTAEHNNLSFVVTKPRSSARV